MNLEELWIFMQASRHCEVKLGDDGLFVALPILPSRLSDLQDADLSAFKKAETDL
jgi:hypothetical protein|uniref:hypothetical protein n=1 Tax=Hafnia alvei TaxID=569 RepID=UPI0024318CF1|nr:hypothetical protein [Hafnia alvei]